MARASTRTMLPLDTWAKILGMEPRHFNQITTDLAPQRSCHEPWVQYAWQGADRVSREDVAEAIAQAESDLVELLGFYPMPQWVDGEVVRTVAPADRAVVGGTGLYNPRGLHLSVQATMGQVISGGIRGETLIGTATRTEPAAPGDTMVLVDLDGDGYAETARIALPTTVTDENEVRCYFGAHALEDEWEIRPLRTVTIAGGNVVIDLDRHQIPHPAQWEAIDPGDIDGDVVGNFELTVAVYRVYNDPSQQCQLQWERTPSDCDCGSTTCASCAWAVQWACLQTRDPRLGIVTYQPADWSETDEEFTKATLVVGRAPERVRLYYRAGYESKAVRRPMVEMDPTLARIIAYYSVTLLDRPLCSCENVHTFVARWQEDKALVGDARYQIRDRDLACPWGTKEGAIWAYNHALKYAIGRSANY